MCMDTYGSLDENLLSRLVTELDDTDTVGVALTGSHARGDATRYSEWTCFDSWT